MSDEAREELATKVLGGGAEEKAREIRSEWLLRSDTAERAGLHGGFGGESGWHSGAGVGVRYLSPIGPIRFDVAGPTGGDTGEGIQVYLGLGQAF